MLFYNSNGFYIHKYKKQNIEILYNVITKTHTTISSTLKLMLPKLSTIAL